jgi:hypothetical protein
VAEPYVLAGSYALLGSTADTNPNFGATGRLAGDLLGIFLSTANETIGSVPSGWTLATETAGLGTPGAAGGLKAYFLWKISDGTESTVTIADSGSYNIGARFVVRGVDPAAPINAITTGTASASTSLSCPEVTTTVPECLAMYCVATDRDGVQSSNFSSWANAGLSSVGELFDEGAASGAGAAIGIGTGVKASAGATGNMAVTTATSDVAVFITIAFAPAVAALSGTAAGSSTASGTLTAYANLLGTASGIATATGTLTTGSDSLSGTASGTSSSVGTLTAYAHLTGTAAGAAAAEANAWAMPIVTRPIGGGDVDVAATIITDGLTASPTIELIGDPESNDNVSGVKWESLFTEIDLRDAGRSVTFKVPFTDWRVSTPPNNNKGYIRHGSQIGNIYGWIPNDNRSVASGVLTAWNNSPLPEAVVQFANIPPVPYDELRAWIAAYHGHANVFRPQACVDANYASSGADAYAFYEFASQTTPDGIDVGGTKAFAVGITKPGVVPIGGKRRFFHTWTHAGESGGLRAMMREMERLIAEATADYTTMVEAAEHVFIFVNTAGMVGAMARGSAEPGDVGEDTNRVWGSSPISRGDVSDPQGVVEASVALLVTQWGVNGSNLLNCVGQIAWHSHTGSQTKFGTYSDGMNAAESFVITTIATAYGTALHNYGASSTGSSTAFARTGTIGGFGITFEWSYAYADFLNEIGASVDTITPALAAAYAAGYFGTDIAGAAAGTSGATGSLTAYSVLSGSASGIAIAAGTLSGSGNDLTGTASGTASATGGLTSLARLTGASAGAASAGGTATAFVAMSGSASGVAAGSAELSAYARLLGTASGQATAVGTLLSDSSALSGTASGSGVILGTLTAFVRLSGSAAGGASVTGTLGTVDGPTPPRPPLARRMVAQPYSRRFAA